MPFPGDQHPIQAFAPCAGNPSFRDRVPLEYLVMRPELGLRGMVVFVDHSRDDRLSADGSQVGHVPDGLRLDVREAAAAGTGAACGGL